MTPKVRLVLVGSLFLAWIGYLCYLVAITRNPVILSRPQFLVADAYVVAKLESGSQFEHPADQIEVVKVLWHNEKKLDVAKLENSKIVVEELSKFSAANGWIGPGNYILPLTKTASGSFMVTKIPPSPGFTPEHKDVPIYPDTTSVREQLRMLIAEFHPQ